MITGAGIASAKLTALKSGTTKVTYSTTDGTNISGEFTDRKSKRQNSGDILYGNFCKEFRQGKTCAKQEYTDSRRANG